MHRTACICNSPPIYSYSCLSVDQLHIEKLAELSAILDSIFHKVVNSTSICGRWG